MDAKENRLTFLEDLAAAKAKAGNTKAANELKMMQRNEKFRESWKRIHRMDGMARASGGLIQLFLQTRMAHGRKSRTIQK